MKRTVTIIFLTCACFVLRAQPDSSLLNFQNEFKLFSKQIDKEFNLFSNHNDSVFSQYLKNSWQEFFLMYDTLKKGNKPIEQPRVVNTPVPGDKKIKLPDSLSNLKNDDGSRNNITIDSFPGGVDKGASFVLGFNFFEKEEKTVYVRNGRFNGGMGGNSINAYFDVVSKKTSVGQLVCDLKHKKKYLSLNDWGYYKLVESVVSAMNTDYPGDVLLTWVIMLKSGYDARVGYAGNDVFLLLPFKEKIYSSWYVEIERIPYYVVPYKNTPSEPAALTVHTNKYPGNCSMSLKMGRLPLIGKKSTREISFKGKTVEIEKNNPLNDFFCEYPFCDLEVYFNTPLSRGIVDGCRKMVDCKTAGCSTCEKVGLLLDFVQFFFAYKLDEEQFNMEKYLFANQLFQFPYSDCEDRAVLFCRLVKQIFGLNCVGLVYPGHVTAAVCFPEGENISGNYLTVNGSDYYVCDPTYKDAPIGYLDGEYVGVTPEIIYVN